MKYNFFIDILIQMLYIVFTDFLLNYSNCSACL